MLLVFSGEPLWREKRDGELGEKSSCEVFACASFCLVRYAGKSIALMISEFCFYSNWW